MEPERTIQGRTLSPSDIDFIRSALQKHWERGRKFISRYICQQWGWLQPNGSLKDMACRGLLLRLEDLGLITLPPRKRQANNHLRNRRPLSIQVDTTPVEPTLKSIMPIELHMVRWTEYEILFNALVGSYHYLGYQQIVGAHLKYIAFSHGRPLGCIGWGAAAWRVMCRDGYLGWSNLARRQRLHLIVQNTRYLILPWVRIPHLASYLLALNAKVLSLDWQKVYCHPVVLLETFVDREGFQGTCYRAANWIYLGETKGRGKYDRENRRGKSVKAVFVYPLRRDFRRILRGE